MIIIVLQIMALVCFFLACVDWPSGQGVRLTPAGLFLWLLTVLLGAGKGLF